MDHADFAEFYVFQNQNQSQNRNLAFRSKKTETDTELKIPQPPNTSTSVTVVIVLTPFLSFILPPLLLTSLSPSLQPSCANPSLQLNPRGLAAN